MGVEFLDLDLADLGIQLDLFRRRRQLRGTPLTLQPLQFRDQFLRTALGDAAMTH
jgi:hypothetical protein